MYNNSTPMQFPGLNRQAMSQRPANPGMGRPANHGMGRPAMNPMQPPAMARPMMQQPQVNPMFAAPNLPAMAQNFYAAPNPQLFTGSIPTIPTIPSVPMPTQGAMTLPQYAAALYAGLTPNRMF